MKSKVPRPCEVKMANSIKCYREFRVAQKGGQPGRSREKPEIFFIKGPEVEELTHNPVKQRNMSRAN